MLSTFPFYMPIEPGRVQYYSVDYSETLHFSHVPCISVAERRIKQESTGGTPENAKAKRPGPELFTFRRSHHRVNQPSDRFLQFL